MRFGSVLLGIFVLLTLGCDSESKSAVTCPPGTEPCLDSCVAIGTCSAQYISGSGLQTGGASGTGFITSGGVGGTGQITAGGGAVQSGSGGTNTQSNDGNGGSDAESGGGGSAGSDGPVDDGGIEFTPVALSCDTTAGTITVDAADVVSDFSQEKPIVYRTGNRGGTSWYAYAATTESTPGSGLNAFAVDPTKSGPCNSGGSLHISSQGNTDYGVGFGVNLAPDVVAGSAKGLYDASADSYTGFGFWMNCAKDVEFVLFKIPDADNDADIETPRCSYSSNPMCNQYGVKNNAIIADQWSYFRVFFSETIQDWDLRDPLIFL
ncbi:MAG: hypothetical protein JXA30_13755 [Deltaproteobacteria bacterium]|nr:hypothetical protein [Deltaproteobacteria bacterium]